MSYLDVYFSRINHMGETTAERIRSGGIRSFEKWKAESPHTVQDLSVERGLYFDGIILTNKDKEYQKIMFLNVSNDIPLLVGDIMTWPLEDGTEEKWILFLEEKKVNGTYRTFSIIRCNYLIKWIDKLGHLQQSWCYLVSSLDSKIKGNFRTWHSLITPQPNKYAEILMPRRVVDRATNFIVEEESWTVVEYDHTSVPGIIYLSLTENKINTIYDDVDNNIADIDTRAKYEIVAPPVMQHFTVGEEVELVYSINKNGIPYTPKDIIYESSNSKVVKIIENKPIAVGVGEAEIYIHINENTDIEPDQLVLKVVIDESVTENAYYIEGPDKIRLDRKADYIVYSQVGTIVEVSEVSIDKIDLATVRYNKDTKVCTVQANNKNKIDKCNLLITLNINDEVVNLTKTISIIPLW